MVKTPLLIASYNNSSKSTTFLGKTLGAKKIRRENSMYKPKESHFILNWGCTTRNLPKVFRDIDRKTLNWINRPENVIRATQKMRTYKILNDAGIPTLVYTKDYFAVRGWMEDGRTVVCRTTENSYGGRDIYIVEPTDVFDEYRASDYLFFTKYIPKKHEFRVHVFDGEVIDITKKSLKTHADDGQKIDPELIDWRVRSHQNGFVFTRDNIPKDLHESVKENSIAAVKALDLDFGAVDIGWNEKNELAFVIEVNTAPGIEGTTLDAYTNAISNFVENRS